MLRAQVLGGGGGVGIHTHRYKRDGKGGTGTRMAGEQTGQETSIAVGSHTHTSSHCVCCCFCGCCVSGCTRPALSTATKARGTIWVIMWGTELWLCACAVFWWVLCQWLNHRARAVKAPVQFPLPTWPLRREKAQRRRSCHERLTEQVAERTAAGGGGVYFLHGMGGGGGGCRGRHTHTHTTMPIHGHDQGH